MGKCGARTQSIGDIKNSGTRHKLGSRNIRTENSDQGRTDVVARSIGCPVKLCSLILGVLAPASVFLTKKRSSIKMMSKVIKI